MQHLSRVFSWGQGLQGASLTHAVWSPLKTRMLLCKYRLLSQQEHILKGIANGFDVGLTSPPDHTLIFRESCIFTTRPGFHHRLHCWGSSIRALFARLPSQRTGAAHWSLSYLPNWSGSQAELGQVQDDSRFILPPWRPANIFSKQLHQLRRLSDDVGNIRQHGRTNIVLTRWLLSSYIRHLGSLSYDSSQTRLTELAVCVLGGHGACRQSCYVWAELQCWGIWFGCRYAGGDLSGSRLWPSHEMAASHLQLLAPGSYLVRSDNAGVVAVVNKGRSRSAHTNDVLRRIYRLMLETHISVKAVYVESRLNIADALSRGDISGFLKGFPHASSKISFPLPSHLSSYLLPY